jgi:hypothetical protein
MVHFIGDRPDAHGALHALDRRPAACTPTTLRRVERRRKRRDTAVGSACAAALIEDSPGAVPLHVGNAEDVSPHGSAAKSVHPGSYCCHLTYARRTHGDSSRWS